VANAERMQNAGQIKQQTRSYSETKASRATIQGGSNVQTSFIYLADKQDGNKMIHKQEESILRAN